MRAARFRRQVMTRDGQSFLVREADISDAKQTIAHARSILSEPEWNVTEPGEFHPTLDQEEAWILSFHGHSHSILLVADIGTPIAPQIVGLVSFTTHPRARTRHRGRLGIGVQSPYRRRGIGEILLRTLLEWAAGDPELERVELSVMAHNTRAIALYRKLGFIDEARLQRAFKLSDGAYYDDIMMVKWIR